MAPFQTHRLRYQPSSVNGIATPPQFCSWARRPVQWHSGGTQRCLYWLDKPIHAASDTALASA
eukprot:3202519-Amphidinium_carterae.6